MVIVRVSLGLSERTAENKVSLWGTIKQSMTGNADFTNINPSLATVDTAVGNMSTAIIDAQSGDHGKIATLQSMESIADNLLHQLGNFVESSANNAALTGGDAVSIIRGAGMDVAKAHSKAPVPNTPGGLKGTSALEGEIALSWINEDYARAYLVEISSDVVVASGTTTNSTTASLYINWIIKDVCHKPHVVLNDLISGTKYAVRIIASGTASKSAPSTPVVVKVL